MKKQYLTPIVEIEQIIEEQFVCFSKSQIEGTTPEVPTGPTIKIDPVENQEGEGLNDAKKGGFFDYDWDE